MGGGNEVTIVVKTQDQSSQGLKSAQGSVKGLGSSIDQFAGGAVKALAGAFAVNKIKAFAGEMVSMSAQMTTWNLKTKTVFEGSADDVEQWADKNAANFGLTGEHLAGLGASFGDLLKPMGFTAEQTAKMTEETVGLAGALSEWTGGQRSAEEVTGILAKGILGQRRALKELGISINETDVQQKLMAKGQQNLTGAALAQAKALATQELIFERSKDAQKAYASGGNEALRANNQLKASIEQVKESMAEKLGPALAGASKLLAGVLANSKATAVLGFAVMGSAAAVAAPKVVALATSVKAGALQLAGLAAEAGPVGILVGSLYALSVAFDGFGKVTADVHGLTAALADYGAQQKVSGELTKIAGKDFGKLHDAFNEIFDDSNIMKAGHLSSQVGDAVLGFNKVSTHLDQARERIDAVDKALAKLAERNPKAAAAAFEEITNKLGSQGTKASDVKSKFDDYGKALKNAGDETKITKGGTDALNQSLTDQSGAAEEAKSALEEWADAQTAMFDPLFGAVDAMDKNAEAQNKVLQANLKVTQAEHALTDAQRQHGKGSKEVAQAGLDLMDAQHGLVGANEDATKSALDVYKAMGKLKTGVEEGTVPLEDAKASLNRWVRAGLITEGQARQVAGQFAQVTKQADHLAKMKDPKVKIQTNAVQAREGLDSVTRAVNSIPRLVPIRISVFGASTADLQVLAHAGPSRAYAHGGITGAAVGGPRGGWIMAGENGPELINLAPGAQVHSAPDTQGILAGGGGADVVVSFERTGDQLIDSIMDAMRIRIRKRYGGDPTAALKYGR